ncbi:serine hydrolase domain-containing protein [Pseudonocardia sp.]|uniref:serine hydrolase domain-containing protein n=1 Tax=Pseudonocardia sp. TaxID=60912 RepID=UPI003D0A19B0
MSRSWIRYLGAVGLTLVLIAAGAAPAAATTSSKGGHGAGRSLDRATLAEVQRIIARFQDTNHTPGVLVGIWSPKGNFVSATGVADLRTGAPLTPDMQFKIASQTKAFTGNLILQLVGEGRVALDDRISKWVAGVPGGDRITIRQLLTMTSGLSTGFLVQEANVNKLATGCTEEEVLAAGAAEPPVAAPGEMWSYSNYGYDLLGRVVELTTGLDISTAIQQRIAEPLGLHRTFLPRSGNGLTKPFTHGYGTGGVLSAVAPGVASDDVTALHQSCVGASGGMVSTLSDLQVWSRALATGALLEPKVWREATKDPIPYVFSDGYNSTGRWFQGLGFVKSGPFIGKEGSFPGYESITMYSPSRRTTIQVVATKQPNGITPTLMFQALAMALYGPNLGFGLTPEQALTPSYTGLPPVAGP